MQLKQKKLIDWQKTGFNLKLIRNDNLNLRRYVCYYLRQQNGLCADNCDECKFKMDSSISRAELAEVFGVSESVVYNWETGKTPISIEDLLFFCDVAHLSLDDVLVYC